MTTTGLRGGELLSEIMRRSSSATIAMIPRVSQLAFGMSAQMRLVGRLKHCGPLSEKGPGSRPVEAAVAERAAKIFARAELCRVT
jgi:hypothetical protein